MSLAQPTPPDRGASPLMSNNPFRNRIMSSSNTASRPISTNPFLDGSELEREKPGTAMNNTVDLFANMNMNDTPRSPPRGPPRMPNGASRRPENIPRQLARLPPPGHKSSMSEEERKHQPSKPRGGPVALDIFADPPDLNKRRDRPPRRNSESSIRDKSSRVLDPEEEKKRRERKYRESKRSGKTKPPSRRLDVIDKLDVTSIYGTGLFHHDGPFDACNPARNRKGSRQAPIQAFPEGSNNMSIGGSGPVNSKIDYDRFHGVGQEAHRDYNEAAIVEEEAELARRPPPIEHDVGFNPVARDVIHGDETIGLGTSTFLEGAPASRAAIQRRQSEHETAQAYDGGPGLSRKKSLAQKIRAVRPNREGRVTSPEPVGTATSPMAPGKSEGAASPFFNDGDHDHEKKGAQIAFVEEQPKPNRVRAPSSPKRPYGLERRVTNEGVGGEESSKPVGFLGRMKSLKGARRPRAERRETSG